MPFFKGQKKIVMRNCGLISPADIEEYFAVGGYEALYKVLIDNRPEAVIEQIKASKLRGRGGAGFQTGLKWDFLRKADSPTKYVICNADEGDPGAYMNRNEIESDPHRLLEGMIIGAFVTGSNEGIVYVRAGVPAGGAPAEPGHRPGARLRVAGRQHPRSRVQLPPAHGGGGRRVRVRRGDRADPLARGQAGPAHAAPAVSRAEGPVRLPDQHQQRRTWYNIAPIVIKGPAWFTETGSPKSPGTKVFSLVGKVASTGLVEMPLGTPLKTFVYDIGGGGSSGRAVKSVQTGGPSGGCIPQDMFDTPVDYETLAQLGSIMGSGGMVVMDEDNCMVDVARYFIEFTHSESCGKCIPCRVGLDKSLSDTQQVHARHRDAADLKTLDELGRMIRDTSLCGLGQSAPNPVLTTMRHFRHEFEDHIKAHRCRAGVCEDLALSPCENSCPLHMNIPRFLQLVKEDRLEDAFESVVMDNPLPASTGRVCQHPCDNRCRRAGLDESVNMREVHRYIADAIYQSDRFDAMVARVRAKKLAPTGRRVAVVGAGPTGVTCAFYLALLGHQVTVYKANPEAGGMLRYALPDYRLPKDVLAKELELIARMGVEYVFNTAVSRNVMLNDLAAGYDAVFLSIGTWKEAWVYLAGTELKGVEPALLFLEAVAKGHDLQLGKKVVVIGGGNAAIDSARTALRMGSEVTVVYRRERKDMPAIPEETEAAEAEGAEFAFLATPHRIIGDDEGRVKAIEVIRTKLGEFDASGRRKPVPTDEIRRIACDTVILAVGETVDKDFAKASGLKISERGTIEVDRYSLETSRANFYAGGDLISGASNVSNAMGYGKRAARRIDRRLMGQKRFPLIAPEFEYEHVIPAHVSETRRHTVSELPADVRRCSFAEAAIGLTAVEACEEAFRCLRCDVKGDNH